VPSELTDARQAYLQASAGPAAQLAPADLHKAQEALAQAEKSFSKDANSYQTRDLAYVAQRKAEMADAQASIAVEQKSKARADSDYEVTQENIVRQQSQELSQTRAALAASERSGEAMAAQLSTEHNARLDAETKSSEAQAELAKLAALQEDERGMVITLSGNVLFRSGEALLLPGAESRLNQVVDALSDRNVMVEGHTDSQGSEEYNLRLSQRRADAVRDYLVHRGCDVGRIQAHGIGEARPIADNATAEGRANNRRVEIVLARDVQN
jgi:outer membrane protein OmpA-like peptidoglycan-associated protein